MDVLEINFDSIYDSLLTSYALQIITYDSIIIYWDLSQIAEVYIILDFIDASCNSINLQVFNLQTLLYLKKKDTLNSLTFLLQYISNNLTTLKLNFTSSSNDSIAFSTIERLTNLTLLLQSLGRKCGW